MIDDSMSKRPLNEMTKDDDNKSDSVEPMVRLRLRVCVAIDKSHVSRLTWHLHVFFL
jgi:hypothetical protein